MAFAKHDLFRFIRDVQTSLQSTGVGKRCVGRANGVMGTGLEIRNSGVEGSRQTLNQPGHLAGDPFARAALSHAFLSKSEALFPLPWRLPQAASPPILAPSF